MIFSCLFPLFLLFSFWSPFEFIFLFFMSNILLKLKSGRIVLIQVLSYEHRLES